jgi:hypothetical protein
MADLLFTLACQVDDQLFDACRRFARMLFRL